MWKLWEVNVNALLVWRCSSSNNTKTLNKPLKDFSIDALSNTVILIIFKHFIYICLIYKICYIFHSINIVPRNCIYRLTAGSNVSHCNNK